MNFRYKISLLIILVFFLFGQTSLGRAQVETPSPEPSLTVTETPSAWTGEPTVETVTPLATETTLPVVVDASLTDEYVTESSSAVVQILIQTSSNIRLSEVRENLVAHGRMVEGNELEKLGVMILEVPLDQLEEKLIELRSINGVGNVELNDAVQALDTIPNDPNWGSQYALTAIHAPQGWDLSTGSSAVTIAIVDSGVDLGHIDLADKIVGGYDFVNNDSVPQDDYGHGTHVAGIAAASGNNGAGIAGVSWGARIMPVKVLDATGGGSFATVAEGIVWAADHGAQIINLSLGAPSVSFVLQSAVEYASNRGVLLIAASGNNGSTPVYCPACYPQVMAVGATNSSNQVASFSSYGPELEIAAPGQSIFSLAPGGYSTKSGTSMAAAHVSGLAAILFSFAGNSNAVRNAMQATALDISPSGWDQNSGAGLIQMDAAIRFLIPLTPTPTSTITAVYSNGSGWSANPNGIFVILPSFTPLSTLSPSASLSTATATQTSTPLIEDSPTPTSTATATSTAEPRSAIRKNWQILISPYSCGAIGLILAGLALGWFARRNFKTW